MPTLLRILLFTLCVTLSIVVLTIAIGRVQPRGEQLMVTLGRSYTDVDTDDLALLDIEHNLQMFLTQTPNVAEGAVTWSHDGNKILFGRSQNGDAELCASSITEISNPICLDLSDHQLADVPLWIPESQTILFRSGTYPNTNSRVYTWEIGGAVRGIGFLARSASWSLSPDGAYVIVTHHTDRENILRAIPIERFSEPTQFHELVLDLYEYAVLSPDGLLIAVSGIGSNQVHILSSSCLYGNTVCETQSMSVIENGVVSRILWMPDSRRLLLATSNDGECFDLQRLNVDDSTLSPVGRLLFCDPPWSISPNGRWLAVIHNHLIRRPAISVRSISDHISDPRFLSPWGSGAEYTVRPHWRPH